MPHELYVSSKTHLPFRIIDASRRLLASSAFIGIGGREDSNFCISESEFAESLSSGPSPTRSSCSRLCFSISCRKAPECYFTPSSTLSSTVFQGKIGFVYC
jgi:hypothetical protein